VGPPVSVAKVSAPIIPKLVAETGVRPVCPRFIPVPGLFPVYCPRFIVRLCFGGAAAARYLRAVGPFGFAQSRAANAPVPT
jgi:hypothetical protein